MDYDQAKAIYEQSKKDPPEGVADRDAFSDLDVGLKNRFSQSLFRARADGVTEMYAAGGFPCGIRANPNHGTLNSFASREGRHFFPRAVFITEDNGFVINQNALNYDVFDAGKVVFFSDAAIENLRRLLNEGVYGAPAPGQLRLVPPLEDIKGLPLFVSQDETGPWHPEEIALLRALGLAKEAGIE